MNKCKKDIQQNTSLKKCNPAIGRKITNMTNNKKSKYKCDKTQKEKNTNVTKCKKTKHKCDIIQEDKIQI